MNGVEVEMHGISRYDDAADLSEAQAVSLREGEN